jgi:hypothetical protein
MLWFERELVGALGTASDQPTQSLVEAFVDGSLRAMPEHIRAGVLASSVLLSSYIAVLRLSGRLDRAPTSLRAHVDRWEVSPIGPLRQYVRVFRSLVLFGENEVVTT